jgi:hypothetical protein
LYTTILDNANRNAQQLEGNPGLRLAIALSIVVEFHYTSAPAERFGSTLVEGL